MQMFCYCQISIIDKIEKNALLSDISEKNMGLFNFIGLCLLTDGQLTYSFGDIAHVTYIKLLIQK